MRSREGPGFDLELCLASLGLVKQNLQQKHVNCPFGDVVSEMLFLGIVNFQFSM